MQISMVEISIRGVGIFTMMKLLKRLVSSETVKMLAFARN